VWGDANFYGKWLLAAAKGNALSNKAIQNCSFAKRCFRGAFTAEFAGHSSTSVSAIRGDRKGTVFRAQRMRSRGSPKNRYILAKQN
jgi:hypothetical protein